MGIVLGLAAGRWVLTKAFVEDSHKERRFLKAKRYVHDESVVTHRKKWKRFEKKNPIEGGIFYNMKALFVMEDLEAKERYQRIVYAGGGSWLPSSLNKAINDKIDGRSLTHIFIDPWVLVKEEGRDRYYDFQDWLYYEKFVSKSSDNREGSRWQNAGVLFKLHFTYLIDTLLKPGEKVKWKNYNIFDKKVQDQALKRRTWRRKQKVKLEEERFKREQNNRVGEDDSDEEDLETVKQRLLQRNRKEAPGRFYVEKDRGSAICEEEARLEASSGRHGGVKRKAMGPHEMVYDLGYMERKRKNKRSAGSYIKADPAKHIKQNGVVDTDKLFKDHHSAPLESLQANYLQNLPNELEKIMNSHPLSNRPKGFTDNDYWNNRHQIKQDWGQHSHHLKREVKPEFEREKYSFPAKSESHQEEIVLDDSDSDSDIEILDETNPYVVHFDEFNLPPGIILKPRGGSTDHDDDIVCLSDEESLDVKPSLKDLVAKLGGIPDVIQCYSDSDEEQEVVEEVLTTREESMDDEIIQSLDVAVSPTSICASEEEEQEVVKMTRDDSSDAETTGSQPEAGSQTPILSFRDSPEAVEISIPSKHLESVSSGQNDSASEPGANTPHPAIQETTLESIISDDGTVTETPSHSASSQPIFEPLPRGTDLLHKLNATILKRQEDIKDHLVIGNLATPVLHYRCGEADPGKSQTKLLSIPTHVIMEFDQHGNYQEPEVRRRGRGMKKNVSGGSETIDYIEEGKYNVWKQLSSLRYLSAYLTSQTLIKPEILNIIWKHFMLDKNEVLLHLKVEDFLEKYFMFFPWSKGNNRLALVDSVLSSLRDVADPKMFSKFEKENSREISDVVIFVEDIIEKCSNENNGAIVLLHILMSVFKTDFAQWWKGEKWQGTFPLIYYVLGGNGNLFKRNLLKVVSKLYRNKNRTMMKLSREFLSLTAMLAAWLDHKDREDHIHQGFKMELAEAIAKILDENTDTPTVTFFSEFSLLQPSWLSLLVSKCLLKYNQSSKKTPRLCEISTMMSGLSLGDDRSLYLSENLQYRLICMSQSHLLLRANWFFTSNKEKKKKFEVYSKMKELSDKGRSRKEVTFKCLLKMTLARQTQDLNTITEIAQGAREVGGESESAGRALMFIMNGENDLGWHPGIH